MGTLDLSGMLCAKLLGGCPTPQADTQGVNEHHDDPMGVVSKWGERFKTCGLPVVSLSLKDLLTFSFLVMAPTGN